MTSFVKLKVGNKVYDKSQSIAGTIIDINYSTNVAGIKVESTGENEIILSRLSDLVIVGENSDEKPKADPNKWYLMVKEFHEAFNHPTSEKPTSLSLDRAGDRQKWTTEEIIEGLHASSDNEYEFIKSYNKFLFGLEQAKDKSLKDPYTKDGIERIVAQADALTDALYFILGSFVEMGLEPDKLFEAVQNSNMSKLFSDGKPRYHKTDGKILKSESFFPPEPFLKKEVERQLKMD